MAGAATDARAVDATAADIVVMGRVVAPYGVKGWVRVLPMTAERDTLLSHGQWWLRTRGGSWQRHRVVDGKGHGAALLVQLDAIADREAAAALNGADVGVPRSALPQVGDDEYYWSDLVGLEVMNRQGHRLGVVAAVEDFGAHPLLRVVSSGSAVGAGMRIPFVSAYVDGVDRAARRIDVDWQEDY